MPDPTETVLTGVFAASLGLFGVFATVRHFFGIGRAESIEPPDLPAGRVQVWFYRPLDLLGAGFVFLVFAGLILASLRLPEEDKADLSIGVLLTNIGFQFFMAGVVAAMVMTRANPVKWLGLRWSAWPWVLLIAPCAVLSMWAFTAGIQFSGYMKWMESLGVETMQDTVKLLQEAKDPRILGLMAFAAVIAAPLCEEIVFRGYFYPVLKRYSGAWSAAICSALVFAAAHGSLMALLPLFVFGLLLVFIYEKTGSIWAPISVHFCFNGATVLVQLAARHFNIPLEGIQ
jgi:membrane protease YdiL (CAAX protease family)